MAHDITYIMQSVSVSFNLDKNEMIFIVYLN